MNHLENFVENILPPLKDNEVYFLSASARNKYLTEEQRKFYGLGRTEMFGRMVAKSKPHFYKKVSELQEYISTYRTKTGQKLPDFCTIIYSNINPSDSIRAYFQLQSEANRKLQESMVNGRTNELNHYFTNIDRHILTEIQRSPGTKHYIDVDFDVESYIPVEVFLNSLNENGVIYHVIQTRSGYHVMMKRDTIQYDFHSVLMKLNETFCSESGEIIINRNAMVPTPGTLQASHLVKIL